MPVGYLDVPVGVDLDRKKDLMAAIYAAVSEVYPFPDDTRIFLREWAADSVSQNGLLGSEPIRPALTLHVPKGVDGEPIRVLMRKLNDAVGLAYQLPDFITFLHEHSLDVVAVNGTVLADDQQRVEAQTKVYG
ncbi:hypothetical protein [Kribbella deserti]|uniref:Uncharacterized protein n=1 Tax=Kribbella deserti TaxID=1926257 RepID=A0ABV6QWI4_9ACTN